jgi:hypothetical protein
LDTEQDLNKLYELYTMLTTECIERGHTPLAAAAIMIKTGMEIYKTNLSEEDYQRIADFISESRDRIKPLN